MVYQITDLHRLLRKRCRGWVKQKTVVIPGGAGFLGSHLCARKLAQGHRVICVDNLQTGRLANIAGMIGTEGFSFFKHDVTEPLHIEGVLDEIFNLACAASPPKYQIDPVHTFRTNIWGAMNLLDLARDKGARILQASTSEVYGDPEISQQDEKYCGRVNTVGPRACYDESKRAAETLFHDYHLRYGVQTRIIRIFNTYGPHMDPGDGRVVSNFIVQALKGQDLTLYGDGSQTRSFCYVDDLLDGMEALMATPRDFPGPVNIGNPAECTVRALAQLVLELTGTSSGLVEKALPQDDPRRRRPDIALAKRTLGWAPQVALRDGLQHTIEYFAAELERGCAGVKVKTT
jgi:UDP-glucuronate decarboxylase